MGLGLDCGSSTSCAVQQVCCDLGQHCCRKPSLGHFSYTHRRGKHESSRHKIHQLGKNRAKQHTTTMQFKSIFLCCVLVTSPPTSRPSPVLGQVSQQRPSRAHYISYGCPVSRNAVEVLWNVKTLRESFGRVPSASPRQSLCVINLIRPFHSTISSAVYSTESLLVLIANVQSCCRMSSLNQSYESCFPESNWAYIHRAAKFDPSHRSFTDLFCRIIPLVLIIILFFWEVTTSIAGQCIPSINAARPHKAHNSVHPFRLRTRIDALTQRVRFCNRRGAVFFFAFLFLAFGLSPWF